jgi:hypothetical protein
MTQKLSPSSFRLDFSGFVTNIWRADLPESQSFDDCLDPTFWMHVVDKVAGDNKANLRGIGDDVVIFKRDEMSKRTYMITGIGAGFIRLTEKKSERVEVETAEVSEASPLQTRWNVGKRGHEVVRTEGNGAFVTVLAGPYQTKAEAVAWINDHLAKMAA